MDKTLVTGSSGFIGSNLVETLVKCNDNVIAIDKDKNLDRTENFIHHQNCNVIQDDVNNIESYISFLQNIDVVYHLAAASDIKKSLLDSTWDLRENVNGTHAVLELIRKLDIPKLIFSSTSALYGEHPPLPTPENAQLYPISQYAASKISAEMFITAYCNLYGIKAWIVRFGNVVGRHQHRGVIYDFMQKLKKNPKELEILGDGKQIKSYFHVSDCISAMRTIPDLDKNKDVQVYNIATYDYVDVTTLADIVCDELKIEPKFKYTGGKYGWKGDIPVIKLSIKKALTTGWKPQYSCEESIRLAVRELDDMPKM